MTAARDDERAEGPAPGPQTIRIFRLSHVDSRWHHLRMMHLVGDLPECDPVRVRDSFGARPLRCLVLAGLVVLNAVAAFAIDVTTCDQFVPAGQVGEVRNDLDCAGAPSGVRLGNRATLRLNGFRLNGPTTSDDLVSTLGRRATIVGPGELSATLNCIIAWDGGLRVDGRGLVIRDCSTGIGAVGPVTVDDVFLRDNQFGVWGTGNVSATNVTAIDSSAEGISSAKTLRVRNVTVAGSGATGVSGEFASIRDATLVGNSRGAIGGTLSIIRSRITDNAGIGARARRVLRVRDSTVTGNGTAPGTVPAGVDLYSERGLVGVTRTTCGKSAGPSGPLGLCADD